MLHVSKWQPGAHLTFQSPHHPIRSHSEVKKTKFSSDHKWINAGPFPQHTTVTLQYTKSFLAPRSASVYQQEIWCWYWIGQKVHLDFSITLYGKPRMDFLANPILQMFALWLAFRVLLPGPQGNLGSWCRESGTLGLWESPPLEGPSMQPTVAIQKAYRVKLTASAFCFFFFFNFLNKS